VKFVRIPDWLGATFDRSTLWISESQYTTEYTGL